MLFKIDSYNCSRCNFTTKQQIMLIKMINTIVGDGNIQFNIAEYEDIDYQSIDFSIEIKDTIR